MLKGNVKESLGKSFEKGTCNFIPKETIQETPSKTTADGSNLTLSAFKQWSKFVMGAAKESSLFVWFMALKFNGSGDD